MTPLNDRVLIRRIDAETTTKGGLVIPDSAKEKPACGMVLAVGAKVHADLVGKEVLFPKYAGVEVMLDGAEHLIAREDELLGVK